MNVSNIYQFLAMLYYFGIVQFPSKADYWMKGHYVPKHTIAHELGMTRKRFKFTWCNFHVSHPTNSDYIDGDKNNNDEDEEIMEAVTERMVGEQEEFEKEEPVFNATTM